MKRRVEHFGPTAEQLFEQQEELTGRLNGVIEGMDAAHAGKLSAGEVDPDLLSQASVCQILSIR